MPANSIHSLIIGFYSEEDGEAYCKQHSKPGMTPIYAGSGERTWCCICDKIIRDPLIEVEQQNG